MIQIVYICVEHALAERNILIQSEPAHSSRFRPLLVTDFMNGEDLSLYLQNEGIFSE